MEQLDHRPSDAPDTRLPDLSESSRRSRVILMSINQDIVYLRRHWHSDECSSAFPDGLLALAVCGRRLAKEDIPVHVRDKFIPEFLLLIWADGEVLFSWH